jgi:hypothetical protein
MRVAKYYNKKVKVKQFAEGDLVWKAILPIGTKYSAFGKWSLNWEGPFRVIRCTHRNAYILKTLLGEEFTTAINGRYLKKYYLVLKLIDNCNSKRQEGTEIAGIRREAVFRNKNSNKREMGNTKVYCP